MNEEMLEELFGVEAFSTRGVNDGYVLKFNHSYIKIYVHEGMSYKVEHYEYGKQLPFKTDIVNINKMREYASKFK